MIQKRLGHSQLLISLALIVWLGACSSSQPAQREPATETASDEPIKLRMASLPFISLTPLFIADKEGFFVDEGLDIKFVEFERTADTVAAHAQGDIDVGTGLITVSILRAMAEDTGILFVADRGHIEGGGCPYSALVTRGELADLPVADLADLNFAVDETTYHHYFADQVLGEAGLSLSDVHNEVLPQPSIPEVMKSGQIDFAVAAEPWTTRLLNEVPGAVYASAGDYLPDFQMLYVSFASTITRDNPEAGRRFMVAYLRGVRQYAEGKTDRNVSIVAEYTGLDERLIEQTCWPPVNDDLAINVDSVNEFQRWAIDRGFMEADAVLSEDQFYDPSYARYAIETLANRD